MRYFLVFAVWLIVLVSTRLLADYFPDGEGFFLVNSTIAFSLGIVFLLIERNFLTFTLAGFEICAILLCLLALIGYKSAGYNVFYEGYEYFLASVNVLEGLFLIYKAPWHGISNGYNRLCFYICDRLSVRYSRVELSKG